MTDNLINIENQGGVRHMVLQRLLRMVPDRDRDDARLQRLLAFRIGIDGEGATAEWLLTRIRELIQAGSGAPLYDFITPASTEPARDAAEEPGS